MTDQPTAADWSERYVAGITPWDLGRPHPELAARLAADPSLGRETTTDAFVPGCGTGHDARALAQAGWDVTAVDFADIDVELPPPSHFVQADALEWSEPADVWFDHTFFCAIPPDRRTDWGEAARRVIRPGGTLALIVFPFGKTIEEGPPWPISARMAAGHLGPDFVLDAETPAQSANRPWHTRWAVFRRSA